MAGGAVMQGDGARRRESGLAMSGVLAVLFAASLFLLAVLGVAHKVSWNDFLLPSLAQDDGSTDQARRS